MKINKEQWNWTREPKDFFISEENLLNNWANGNPGYRLAKASATPEEYPTVPDWSCQALLLQLGIEPLADTK